MRKPFQGTANIIRFNWHLYLMSCGILFFLILLTYHVNERLSFYSNVLFWLITITTLASLLVSLYVYDISGLYKLDWLSDLGTNEKKVIININAGFDETSYLLQDRFRNAELIVFDFYDPAKHTEVSIKRARRAYPPFPHTKTVNTTALPLEDNVADNIYIIFSAHEIRNEEERMTFFKELNRILKPEGQIIVTEQLRDVANLLAYNIGFLHFHSKATWLKTFHSSGFKINKELKITPFISTFMLVKNGTSS